MTFARFRKTIRALYEGATPRWVRFRNARLAFDIVAVAFIVATSFVPRTSPNGNARRALTLDINIHVRKKR